MGEPINAVLSGHSDPEVLKDAETDGGFRNYMLYVPALVTLCDASTLTDMFSQVCRPSTWWLRFRMSGSTHR
jgi:hypothetical protein